jgi:hypothetical protein
MKFRVQTQDLHKALEITSIVTPMAVTAKGGSGYLFVVKGNKCYLNSRDEVRCIRTEIPITDSDGDGFFVYPADKIAGLKYIDGWTSFEACHDPQEDRYWVKYETERGASGERPSYDPSLMMSLDEDLEKEGTEYTFPSAVLREGISATKSYLASADDKSQVEGHFKALQLFDESKPEFAKGNGCLFAADSIRACYFQCSAFKDKGLAIHGRNIPAIMAFLSKCGEMVTVRLGATVDFLIDTDSGRVLSWSKHTKQHTKYNYYSDKQEKYILRASKEPLIRALRHVRVELDAHQGKIKVLYKSEDRSLRFQASNSSGGFTNSAPVTVEPVVNEASESGKDGLDKDLTANVNIDHLLDLVDPVRGHQVELRIAVFKAKKENHNDIILFRTIEDFWLSNSGKVLVTSEDGAHSCRITRFMPSKD